MICFYRLIIRMFFCYMNVTKTWKMFEELEILDNINLNTCTFMFKCEFNSLLRL